jgi:hypothetical protein
MNKIIMQLWEESERGFGSRPDGCSFHIDSNERKRFVDEIYKSRECEVEIPDEYDRIVGDEIEVFVDDKLFNVIKDKKSVKILQSDLYNLLKLEEIIIKN